MAWTIKSILRQRGFDIGKQRIDGGAIGHVTRHNEIGAELCGKRVYAFLELLALVGETQLRTMFGQSLCNAPRDRFVVGEAHNEATFAFHKFCHGRSFTRFIPVVSGFMRFGRVSQGFARLAVNLNPRDTV